MKIEYTIGVDLGGTNTHVALVDSLGQIQRQIKFATKDYPDSTEFVRKLGNEIKALTPDLQSDTNSLKGIGIGAPAVNYKTRSIENPAELPWKGVLPLAEMLESETGMPVWISNDANAAAIGEMIYGNARGMKNFIVITIGTGVGSGIVIDGHVINGQHGFAGELGHMTFPFAADRPCGCGRKGCLQTCCSASGIVETARRFLDETDVPSSLRSVPASELNAKEIGEAFLTGDEIARKVFFFTEEALGKAFAEFCAFSDPEAIILFGGVADPRELSKEHIKEIMDKHSLYLYHDTKILFSLLSGADAAILGAASLPYQQ